MFFKDESCIGFILRVKILYDDSSFDDVFYPSGVIRKKFIPNNFVLEYLKSISFCQLAFMLRNSSETLPLFFYPSNYDMDYINKFLFNNEIICDWKELRFCIHCIRECLYIHGVGYIKNEWSHNGFCSAHMLPLMTTCYNSRDELIDKFKTVLSGIIPESSFNYIQENGDVKSERFIILKPCVKKYFLGWLSMHTSKIFKILRRKLQFKLIKSLQLKHTEWLDVSDEILSQVLNFLLESNVGAFSTNFYSVVEPFREPLTISGDTDNSIIAFKMNQLTCNTCTPDLRCNENCSKANGMYFNEISIIS